MTKEVTRNISPNWVLFFAVFNPFTNTFLLAHAESTSPWAQVGGTHSDAILPFHCAANLSVSDLTEIN